MDEIERDINEKVILFKILNKFKNFCILCVCVCVSNWFQHGTCDMPVQMHHFPQTDRDLQTSAFSLWGARAFHRRKSKKSGYLQIAGLVLSRR